MAKKQNRKAQEQQAQPGEAQAVQTVAGTADVEQAVQEGVEDWLVKCSVPMRLQEIDKRKSSDDGPHDVRYLLTGIEAIDKALGGGILSPGLTVLGAAPGIGKTTLALQIAQHIAKMEPTRKVLFFSLEMAVQALIPKIQACWRRAAECARAAALSEQIENMEKASGVENAANSAEIEDAEVSEGIEDAASVAAAADAEGVEDMQTPIGPLPDNFFIIDDRTPRPMGEAAWSAPAISSVVRQIVKSQDKNAPRPFVIVDYLQFIPPTKEGVEERIRVNEALQEFSGITDRAAVLLISSLNRSAYNRPISEEAFKETGLIEFSADVLLGMQYSAISAAAPTKNGTYTVDRVKEAAKNPREVELVVLKNRYAGMGDQVPLHFYPRENFFIAAGEDKGIVATDPFYINIAYRIADRLRCPRSEDEEMIEGGKLVFKGKVKRSRLRGKKEQSKLQIEIRFRIEQSVDAPIAAFDMVVADAIYTLYRRGAKGFSVASIQQLITGGRPSYARRNEAIRDSVEKLRNSIISIDCSNWANRDDYFRDRIEQVGDLAGGMAFLNLEKTGSGNNSKYEFDTRHTGHPLPLYLYAEWSQRFVDAPAGLFDMGALEGQAGRGSAARAKGGKGAFSYTPGNVVAMHYLIEQIELIRNPSNNRTKKQIALFELKEGRPDGVFARMGAATEDEARKLLAKERASRGSKPLAYILDRFCDAGYINGYEWGEDRRNDLVILLKI